MENESFKQAIKSYLDERAKADELFAKSYAKENKSLDECYNYILCEAKKRGNAVAMTDNEVFGMAVHYYDEDDIKVEKIPANVAASVSAPAKTEKPVTLTEEQHALLRKKPTKAKKEVTEGKDKVELLQLSLF